VKCKHTCPDCGATCRGPERPSVVYFMQPIPAHADGRTFIKIGWSRNVKRRREVLSSGPSGIKFAILATMPGGWKEEQAVHKRFAYAKTSLSEVFHPVPELMAFIEELKANPAGGSKP
jgi:hypothetical protein